MDKSVSLSHSPIDCHPRRLWQELFNLYLQSGADLENLDNLLIDYDNCKALFEELEPGWSFVFLWGCVENHFMTGWYNETDWLDGDPELTARVIGYDVTVLVHVTNEEITLRRIK